MFNNIQELNDYLEKNDYTGTAYFVEPSYLSALEGISQDGRLVYNYTKMVEFLIAADTFTTEEDAIDYLEFNTIRAIPYMGEKCPIILYDL